VRAFPNFRFRDGGPEAKTGAALWQPVKAFRIALSISLDNLLLDNRIARGLPDLCWPLVLLCGLLMVEEFTMLTRFQDATIIDCSGQPPFKGSIVVDGERIVSVSNSVHETPGPAADAIIDCEGLTIMPGMTEAHCHISFNDLSSMYQAVEIQPEDHSLLAMASQAFSRLPPPSPASMLRCGTRSTRGCSRAHACALRARRFRRPATSVTWIRTT
jgi:hypothetical protein